MRRIHGPVSSPDPTFDPLHPMLDFYGKRRIGVDKM